LKRKPSNKLRVADSRQQAKHVAVKVWDCMKADGTLEANQLVPIGSIREPGQTNRRKEKSDYVTPCKWLVKRMEAQERSHKYVVDPKLMGWEKLCMHGWQVCGLVIRNRINDLTDVQEG
jgi:hypothetical protein